MYIVCYKNNRNKKAWSFFLNILVFIASIYAKFIDNLDVFDYKLCELFYCI